jgi:hypothetical protein
MSSSDEDAPLLKSRTNGGKTLLHLPTASHAPGRVTASNPSASATHLFTIEPHLRRPRTIIKSHYDFTPQLSTALLASKPLANSSTSQQNQQLPYPKASTEPWKSSSHPMAPSIPASPSVWAPSKRWRWTGRPQLQMECMGSGSPVGALGKYTKKPRALMTMRINHWCVQPYSPLHPSVANFAAEQA